MQIIILTFPHSLNESLQIGDAVYYVPTSPSGNFTTGALDNVIRIGVVTSFINNQNLSTVQFLYDDTINPGTGLPFITLPGNGDYIMFERDKINTSGLIGYYADIKLVNNSKEKVELFSIGSDVFESSK